MSSWIRYRFTAELISSHDESEKLAAKIMGEIEGYPTFEEYQNLDDPESAMHDMSNEMGWGGESHLLALGMIFKISNFSKEEVKGHREPTEIRHEKNNIFFDITLHDSVSIDLAVEEYIVEMTPAELLFKAESDTVFGWLNKHEKS